MRLRISGPHAIVVEIAARIASREGRPSKRLRGTSGTPTCRRDRGPP